MKATKENILFYLKDLKVELKDKGIQKIGLFGSFANNSQNIYSDIDIAISKDKNYLKNNDAYTYFELLNFIKEKIRNKFHKNIDIFDLNSKSELKEFIEKELIYV